MFLYKNNIKNVLGDYRIWISEMNNNNIKSDQSEELGMLCY